MNFEDKVRSLTAYEIIMAMVKGLEKPKIKVNMHTYGGVIDKPILFGLFDIDICVGCAATNTICQISGVKFNTNNISFRSDRSQAINSDEDFLERFEEAIDYLRCGDLKEYNNVAKACQFAEIKFTDELKNKLMILTNNYFKSELKSYKELANYQINQN